MADLPLCVGCGRAVAPPTSPEALCPYCLLALGLAARPSAYRIIAPLGEGRLGPLALAAPEGEPGRRVAVKYLSPPAGQRLDPARFDASLTPLVELSHARVVPILDGGWIDATRAFVVTPFLPGGSIDLYCGRSSPPEELRRELVGQVSDAIRFAHQRGVVHGGLAASDVLVTLEGGRPAVRVRDFGLRQLTGWPADAGSDFDALDRLSRSLLPA